MNLYLLTRNRETDEYDVYLGAVVKAKSENDARFIHPNGDEWDGVGSDYWPGPREVKVKLIGKGGDNDRAGVVLSSFRAG